MPNFAMLRAIACAFLVCAPQVSSRQGSTKPFDSDEDVTCMLQMWTSISARQDASKPHPHGSHPNGPPSPHQVAFLSARQGSTNPFLDEDFLRDASNPLDVYEDMDVTTPPPASDSTGGGTAEDKDAGKADAKDSMTDAGKAPAGSKDAGEAEGKDTGKAEAKDAGEAKAEDEGKPESKDAGKAAGAPSATANSSTAGAAKEGADEDLVEDAGAQNATENSTNVTVGGVIEGGDEDLVKDAGAVEHASEETKRWEYCKFFAVLLLVSCCCFTGACHSSLGQAMGGFFNFVFPFVVILYLCDSTSIFRDWWNGKHVCTWCRLVCLWAFIQIAFGIFFLGCSMLGIGAAGTMGFKTIEERQLEKERKEERRDSRRSDL